MPVGRPTLLTPELVEEAARLAADGLPVSSIATGLGISERTIQRWMKEAEDAEDDSLHFQFRRVIHRAYDRIGSEHLRNLREQSANGSTHAATWWLTHHPRFRDQFSDAAATRREVASTLATVVQVVQQSDLTPEQQDHLLLRMQAAGLGSAA